MPLIKLAQIDIGQELKVNPTTTQGISQTPGYSSLGEFISALLPNVYLFAALILFVLLVAGGFVIITSAGNPDKSGKGAKAVTGAIIGFVLIFASFWLIKLIEFLTGIKIFAPNLGV